jgi:hypothetical protein
LPPRGQNRLSNKTLQRGKIQGQKEKKKRRRRDGEEMEKRWRRDGEEMEKRWRRDGEEMEKRWRRDGDGVWVGREHNEKNFVYLWWPVSAALTPLIGAR